MAGAAEANTAEDGLGYRVDDLVIDIGAQRVLRGEREIPLPQLSFEFLLALARAAPNVLSVDQLMERVWPGLVVGPETVSQRVKLVRDALGDESQAPRYIQGVRGRGYRMLAHVSPLTPPPVDPRLLATSVTGNVTTAVNVAAAAGAAIPEMDDSKSRTFGGAAFLATGALPPEFLADEPAIAQAPPSQPAHRKPWWLIAIAIIVLGIGAMYYAQRRVAPQSVSNSREPSVAQAPKTIAVLPLIDISPGGGNEYLGDGLAEELTDRLTRIPGVRVAARTSAFAFKGKPADVREIAQSLAVRHVLEGSVRREGERLRVTAQLIDAQSGYHVWSHSYDRQWKDLLDIQDDLARSIVGALQLVLTSEIIERLDHPKTTSLEAFDLYLSGLAKLGETSTSTQLDEAEKIFQTSLEVDPKFARAYAGLCETYTAGFRRTKDTAIANKAEKSCNQALSMDPSLREVEQALANLYVLSGRADQAIGIYQRILARIPSDPDVFLGLAQAYERLVRPQEAETTYHRAIDADPSYARPHIMFGTFLFNNGRFTEAASQFRRGTELAPNSPRAFNNLGGTLQITGDFEGAARALERSLELEPTQLAYMNMGTLYFYLGRFQDAEKMYLKSTELAPRDNRTWGTLADAQYQIADRRAEAQRSYERAITLAKLELQVTPNDPDTLARLAYYTARAGNPAQAKEFIAKALATPTDSFYVYYATALAQLEVGDIDGSLVTLEKAIELGYSTHLVKIGPEFARLRDDKRFQRLLALRTRPSAG